MTKQAWTVKTLSTPVSQAKLFVWKLDHMVKLLIFRIIIHGCNPVIFDYNSANAPQANAMQQPVRFSCVEDAN